MTKGEGGFHLTDATLACPVAECEQAQLGPSGEEDGGEGGERERVAAPAPPLTLNYLTEPEREWRKLSASQILTHRSCAR